MTLGGYAGRVGHIDLTSGSISYAPIPEEWAMKYIGARGVGVRYVYEAGPTVDPLGPDNVMAFMNGPLTGTEASMSGRLALVTKSPLTGTVTDSHIGGWSAARLRWSGFDRLVFKGSSATPVYAYVSDGTACRLNNTQGNNRLRQCFDRGPLDGRTARRNRIRRSELGRL